MNLDVNLQHRYNSILKFLIGKYWNFLLGHLPDVFVDHKMVRKILLLVRLYNFGLKTSKNRTIFGPPPGSTVVDSLCKIMFCQYHQANVLLTHQRWIILQCPLKKLVEYFASCLLLQELVEIDSYYLL